MATKTFKAKSLVSYKTDFEIENRCHTVNFISFEAAIELLIEKYNLKSKPIGYRVTEQGIEIIRD